ncbi:MAG: hypothetical protein M1820_002556 [Bogoriella megaspora]|nr:MAG: hypothetical protein M1820_002556 [Bogoriella megaspora]
MSTSPNHRESLGTETIRENSDGLNLSKTQTGAMTISPELFEKLFLSPKTPHAGDNIKRFANPTAMGFVGFVISVFTLGIVLMGWGGANGLSGVAGIFFFTGPVLLVLGTIFEYILGNFFAMMIQSLFSVFWLSFGLLQLPTLNLAGAYSPTGNMEEGLASKEYNAAVGLYLIVWGFAFFTYFIFTLKTNCVLAAIFVLTATGSWVLAGAYFRLGNGDHAFAQTLQMTSGAILFVVAALGWYMTFVIMATEMRLPVNLPVGDLTHFWPSTDAPLSDVEKQA